MKTTKPVYMVRWLAERIWGAKAVVPAMSAPFLIIPTIDRQRMAVCYFMRTKSFRVFEPHPTKFGAQKNTFCKTREDVLRHVADHPNVVREPQPMVFIHGNDVTAERTNFFSAIARAQRLGLLTKEQMEDPNPRYTATEAITLLKSRGLW